jgi:hypothetical protein
MAFSVDIDVERKLAVVNGFVEIPDGQRTLRTKLTPLDVLALIPGSTLIRLSPHSAMTEIIVSDPTAVSISGGARQQNRLFVKLPAFDRLDGPPEDWFATLRAAAEAA